MLTILVALIDGRPLPLGRFIPEPWPRPGLRRGWNSIRRVRESALPLIADLRQSARRAYGGAPGKPAYAIWVRNGSLIFGLSSPAVGATL